MRRLSLICVVLILITSVCSCHKKEQEDSVLSRDISLVLPPEGFPEIPFPQENPFSVEKWALGKKLFYDNLLSIDYSISCASCHNVSAAFSDVVALSLGAGGKVGRRNAPTLANVAYHPYFTREGGLETLEKQILVPIQEHDEFDFNIVEIAKRMNEIPAYVAASKAVFDRVPDPYVITRAIATFERTLVSGNSAYDKFIQFKDSSNFNSAARRGMQLFFSNRTECSSCHSGFNFTNYSFENNGLYEVYADNGRERLTDLATDNARFKVPTLRNIALTAPYMHDGSISTLTDVIAHYNSGGNSHPNKSELIRPLGLTKAEQQDLVAFLHTLTDVEFVNNKDFYTEE